MPNVIEKETETKKKGLTTQQTVLILGVVVIIAGAILAYLLLRPEQALPEGEVPTGLVITEENVAEINRDLREKVAEGMFETHMNMEWSFPDGTSPSDNALMGNSVNNNYPFYFDVTLKETDEVVFTSGLIPVGKQIAEIVLDKDLEPGTYPASVGIHMQKEDGTPVDSNMGIGVTLIVRN